MSRASEHRRVPETTSALLLPALGSFHADPAERAGGIRLLKGTCRMVGQTRDEATIMPTDHFAKGRSLYCQSVSQSVLQYSLHGVQRSLGRT